MRTLTSFLILVAITVAIAGLSPVDAISYNSKSENKFVVPDSLRWPPGSEVVRFENIEGIVLIRGRLRGNADVDTTGPLALDTGAGYLALDLGLARLLGLADTAGTAQPVDIAQRPLSRLTLGGWAMDQVHPVLTVNAEVVRRVCDRPVLGLIGQKLLRDRAVWIDYRERVVAFIPAEPIVAAEDLTPRETLERSGDPSPSTDSVRVAAARDSALARSRGLLAGVLTLRAVPVPFALVGDGKILVHGSLSDPRPPHYSKTLNLLVDTGATKCVLFEETLGDRVGHADAWPALRGLSAPTLIGAAEARIARVPEMGLDAAKGRLTLKGVDAGVIRSQLGEVLSRVAGQTIHGLLGYSFLKRFRVVVDYPNRVMWLDPIPDYRDDRPLEYCHVGIQVERQAGAVIVTGVATESPAARAGIARGDEVVALDGTLARPLDLITLTRRMEGEPGRTLTLVIRRGAVAHTHRLVRRRLL